MKSQDSIKKIVCVISGILYWFGIGLANAETQTFTASIRFISPLTLSDVADPDFGTFETGAAGRNFILGTDGSISGTDANAYIDGASAGSMVIHGSASQKIDIIAQNLVDDGGISIANIICNYGDAGDMDCGTGIAAVSEPAAAGTTLLIGMNINTTTAHADGDSASPTFDIIVSYN